MLRVLNSFPPELDWRLLAAVCLVVLLAGIAVIVRFRRSQTGRLSDKGQLLELALNNMTQGVVMFDAKARLVVCNDRYLKIYDLPPNIVKPGARLADIVRLRARSGSLPDDPDKYVAELMEIIAAGKVVSFVSELPDGRSIAVVNRAIPGGSYWIGTHHDITERRKVEQKNALLGAQEARRAVIEEAIAWFRESVEGVLTTVGDSVAAMRSTASALSAISNDTTTHTAGAVKTSGDAFESVEIAANAAEEMSKSIAEINHQLARATEVVRAATAEAQSTNEDIAGLRGSGAEDRRRHQAHPQRRRADQSARRSMPPSKRRAPAPPARALPWSPPRSKRWRCRPPRPPTSSPRRSPRCRSSTQSAVRAIGSISGRVQDIEQFTAAIASAVEQQHASTSQISSNVAAAASGTKSVVSVLQRVSTAISDMQSSADTVLTASQAVEKAAADLRGSVDGFLRKVAM